MQDILIKIKKALLLGHYGFSEKAKMELERDGLEELDAIEAIMNSPAIYKKIRSSSPFRKSSKEYLYVIQGTNYEGQIVYTKGKLIKEKGSYNFYFLISSKKNLEV